MRTSQQRISQNVTGMVVILAATAGCSGASNSDGLGVGGAVNGGAPANGGTTSGIAAGGSTATTGGVVSTGGVAIVGGNTSRGGTNATGGAVSSGGANTTGGVTSGGAVSTGGAKVIGGSSTTGGSVTTGGASAAGGTSATGGKAAGGVSATGGASAAGGSTTTGGKSTGGASATGGSGNGTGGAATGGSTGTGTCPKGPTKGSDVAVIGESFIAMTHGITKEIEAKARAAGSLASGDTYKDKSVSGTLLSGSNANAIPKQYDSAVPVKFVLMDGGGNDCLQANDGDAALAAATTLFQKMGQDGVEKVQYFFYPDPIGSQYASLKTCLDALRPKMKALCEGLTAPKCYWLDLRTVWNGHSEYTSDGIHPTATGSTVTGDAIWAEMVKNCIAQ